MKRRALPLVWIFPILLFGAVEVVGAQPFAPSSRMDSRSYNQSFFDREKGLQSIGGLNRTYRYTGLDYEPYAPEEFPGWAHTLRRFETIFFGSLPFSFLFSSLGFDFYAWFANDFDDNYLPLFLGTSPEKEDFNRSTMWGRITISISLSAIIASLDYLIDRRKDEASP